MRLRDVAEHNAPAPDRRPPRPDRLPAPAPAPGRRRRLEHRPRALATQGAYRVFADFRPTGGHGDDARLRVLVGGAFAPRALPAPASTARVDGYDVALRANEPRRREATLTYTVSRDGRPVAVQPYLGASGHLVALRAGDLAYLHVHPLEGGAAAGRIAFAATYPSAGRYRLFLQFRHEGRVHTAALTQEVATA